jgi:hypothetical protein
MTGNRSAAAEEKSRTLHRRGSKTGAILNAAEQALPLTNLARQLGELPLVGLREQWEAAHPGLQLPNKLPRDLLVRSIAWTIQGARHGGLPSATGRALEKMSRQLATTGTLEIERSVRPKPGTRLIREWRGKTYVVEVSDHGFTYGEQTYSSLSHVAWAITGTRWSGPRFFGIRSEDLQDGRGEQEEGSG